MEQKSARRWKVCANRVRIRRGGGKGTWRRVHLSWRRGDMLSKRKLTPEVAKWFEVKHPPHHPPKRKKHQQEGLEAQFVEE